jgi:hypothetical protein
VIARAIAAATGIAIAMIGGCSSTSDEPACPAVPLTAPWSTMQLPVSPGGSVCSSTDKGIDVHYRARKAPELIDGWLDALARQGFRPEGSGAADRTEFHYMSDLRGQGGRGIVFSVDGRNREGLVRVKIWKIAPGW